MNAKNMATMKIIVENKKCVRNMVNANPTTTLMNMNFPTNVPTVEVTIQFMQDFMKVGEKEKNLAIKDTKNIPYHKAQNTVEAVTISFTIPKKSSEKEFLMPRRTNMNELLKS